jgi:hypothetical protein
MSKHPLAALAVNRRLALLAVTAGLTVAVFTVTASALAGPPAGSTIAVEVQAQNLTGLRPDGGMANVQVKAVVQGEDASSLAGEEARLFGARGAHGYWPATGSLVGNLVTLSGVLTESNIGLVGTPVELEANSSTGAVTVTIGPFSAGSFLGQTIVVNGFGSVKIKTS